MKPHCPPPLPRLLHRCSRTHTLTHTEHLAAANFNPREEDENEGEGRRRETLKNGERRRPSGEKRGEGDVPVGSQAPNNQPADWLESFYSPAAASICCCCYCTGVCVHFYDDCLFVCVCMCVQDTQRPRGRHSISVGNNWLCVWKHLHMCVCIPEFKC